MKTRTNLVKQRLDESDVIEPQPRSSREQERRPPERVPSLVEESQLDIRPDVVQGGVDVADEVEGFDDHLSVQGNEREGHMVNK